MTPGRFRLEPRFALKLEAPVSTWKEHFLPRTVSLMHFLRTHNSDACLEFWFTITRSIQHAHSPTRNKHITRKHSSRMRTTRSSSHVYLSMHWAGVCVSQHALGGGCLPRKGVSDRPILQEILDPPLIGIPQRTHLLQVKSCLFLDKYLELCHQTDSTFLTEDLYLISPSR